MKLAPPKIKWMIEPTYDQDGVQFTAGIDSEGREHGDPIPLRPPIGLAVEVGDPTQEALKRLMSVERSRFMAAVAAEGFETEEEANDFYVEDDMYPADPGLPWDGPFDIPEDVGNGRTLASAPVQGENRAAEHATPPPTPKEDDATAKPEPPVK